MELVSSLQGLRSKLAPPPPAAPGSSLEGEGYHPSWLPTPLPRIQKHSGKAGSGPQALALPLAPTHPRPARPRWHGTVTISVTHGKISEPRPGQHQDPHPATHCTTPSPNQRDKHGGPEKPENHPSTRHRTPHPTPAPLHSPCRTLEPQMPPVTAGPGARERGPPVVSERPLPPARWRHGRPALAKLATGLFKSPTRRGG